MKSWTLDQLKSELSQRTEIKGWVLTREHTHRRERYFLRDEKSVAVDQDRDTRALSTSGRFWVNLPHAEGRQGEVSLRLFTDQAIGPQLDRAILAARETDHQAWSLPATVPSSLPQLKTADPEIAEDLERAMSTLTDRISGAIAEAQGATFNSAELFVSLHERELHLSNGLAHRSSQTRVYTEAAFSFSRPAARPRYEGELESDEYLSTAWSVGLQDCQVERLFSEAAARSQMMLDFVPPQSGKYQVLVDAEVLSTVLQAVFGRFSGASRYLGLPHFAEGAEMVPGLEAGADGLSIRLDPLLALGADAAVVSEQGLLQEPLDLVVNNQVRASALDQQYGAYLGVKPTTTRGDLVVGLGSRTPDTLRKSAPQVLEILQFSGLFVDGSTGTFSSEIRLARLHERESGRVTTLKGGSLSGSVFENFRGLLLSNQRVRSAHFPSGGGGGSGYFGPSHALLSGVSIVGSQN